MSISNEINKKNILVIQLSENSNSKKYQFYSNSNEVVEYLLDLYEEFLAEENINQPEVKLVELTDFLFFFYSFYDFAYLEYDETNSIYKPYGRDWFTDIIKSYFNYKSSYVLSRN